MPAPLTEADTTWPKQPVNRPQVGEVWRDRSGQFWLIVHKSEHPENALFPLTARRVVGDGSVMLRNTDTFCDAGKYGERGRQLCARILPAEGQSDG